MPRNQPMARIDSWTLTINDALDRRGNIFYHHWVVGHAFGQCINLEHDECIY